MGLARGSEKRSGVLGPSTSPRPPAEWPEGCPPTHSLPTEDAGPPAPSHGPLLCLQYLTRQLGLDSVAFGYLQTTFGVLQLLGGPLFGRYCQVGKFGGPPLP